ncbi:hypothetical protein MP638_004304 [Amoeboaphelidium occidentale]|nr:hypothetical protein MP638_004304 [Amoeboaphelidium occidentale]
MSQFSDDIKNILTIIPVYLNVPHQAKSTTLQNVSALYQPPRLAIPIPNYSLERSIIEKYKRQLITEQEEKEAQQKREERLKLEVERKRKEKINSIAPGLGDVLEPVRVTSGSAPATASSSSSQQGTPRMATHRTNAASATGSNAFNFLEFEQGLPPPNPWDLQQTVDDDLKQLNDVLSPASLQTSPQKTSYLQQPNRSLSVNLPLSTASPTPPRKDFSALPPEYMAPLSTIRAPSNINGNQDQFYFSVPVNYRELYTQFTQNGHRPDGVALGLKLYSSFYSSNESGELHTTLAEFLREFDKLTRTYRPEDIEHCYWTNLKYPPSINATKPRPAGHLKFSIYLTAFTKLRELGFPQDSIRVALQRTDPESRTSNIANVDYSTWGDQAIEILLRGV